MKISLLQGDCRKRMAELSEASVGAVIVDPPYGLEFMGKEWDKLTGPKKTWEAGGGFAKPGIGQRNIQWPSFSATSRHGSTNPTCAKCGGRLRGKKKCECPKPHDHWKPVGKRRKLPQDTPDHITGSGMGEHLKAMQEWHLLWLQEAHRILRPGGVIKVFGGTRVFHRLAAAMQEAGFQDIKLEAWGYGSGFPKSHNVAVYMDRLITEGRSREIKRKGMGNLNGKFGEAAKGFVSQSKAHTITTDTALAWEGWGTALKPAWEPVLVGRKDG